MVSGEKYERHKTSHFKGAKVLGKSTMTLLCHAVHAAKFQRYLAYRTFMPHWKCSLKRRAFWCHSSSAVMLPRQQACTCQSTGPIIEIHPIAERARKGPVDIVNKAKHQCQAKTNLIFPIFCLYKLLQSCQVVQKLRPCTRTLAVGSPTCISVVPKLVKSGTEGSL